MTYSVSELEAYSRCPMEYFLKYQRQLPAQVLGETPDLPGNVLGDIVHAVIRTLLLQEGDNVTEIVRGIALSQEIPFRLIPMAELQTLCGRAMAYHRARGWQEFRVETAFSMKLNDAIVHGTVDFLGRDAQGWHIVDYKTDRLAAKSELAERARSYHLQLMAYARAATKAGVTPITDTTLLFLRLNAPVTEIVTEAALAAADDEMATIIAKSDAENGATGKTPPCRTCPYHHNGLCWEDKLRKAQPA